MIYYLDESWFCSEAAETRTRRRPRQVRPRVSLIMMLSVRWCDDWSWSCPPVFYTQQTKCNKWWRTHECAIIQNENYQIVWKKENFLWTFTLDTQFWNIRILLLIILFKGSIIIAIPYILLLHSDFWVSFVKLKIQSLDTLLFSWILYKIIRKFD